MFLLTLDTFHNTLGMYQYFIIVCKKTLNVSKNIHFFKNYINGILSNLKKFDLADIL